MKKVNYRAKAFMGIDTQEGDTYKTLRLFQEGKSALLLHMPRKKGECPSLEIAIKNGHYYESLDINDGYVNITKKDAEKLLKAFS